LTDEFLNLPPAERIRLFLNFAADARVEAKCADGMARETYLRIAEQWELLAARTAEHIDPSTE